MGLGCGGQIGGLGDSQFSVIGTDVALLLSVAGVAVTVTRYDASAPRDVYGVPQAAPTTFQATVILASRELKVVETVAGGRRVEVLTIVGLPGTLQENDVVLVDGHLFDIRLVNSTSVHGARVIDSYEAYREVDAA